MIHLRRELRDCGPRPRIFLIHNSAHGNDSHIVRYGRRGSIFVTDPIRDEVERLPWKVCLVFGNLRGTHRDYSRSSRSQYSLKKQQLGVIKIACCAVEHTNNRSRHQPLCNSRIQIRYRRVRQHDIWAKAADLLRKITQSRRRTRASRVEVNNLADDATLGPSRRQRARR